MPWKVFPRTHFIGKDARLMDVPAVHAASSVMKEGEKRKKGAGTRDRMQGKTHSLSADPLRRTRLRRRLPPCPCLCDCDCEPGWRGGMDLCVAEKSRGPPNPHTLAAWTSRSSLSLPLPTPTRTSSGSARPGIGDQGPRWVGARASTRRLAPGGGGEQTHWPRSVCVCQPGCLPAGASGQG